MIQEMIEAMENYNKRGSNWIFKKAIRLEVNFVRWKPLGGKPLGGSGWVPMPEKLAQKKAIINIKNTDNFCFKLCIARAKNPVKSHPEVVTEKLRRQAEEFRVNFETTSGKRQNSRAYSLRILFSFGFSIFGNGTRVEKGGK